jgi:hypothetical protein
MRADRASLSAEGTWQLSIQRSDVVPLMKFDVAVNER